MQTSAGRMVHLDQLSLPLSLQHGFERWIEWYWDAVPGSSTADRFDARAFCEEGQRLARELKGVLGDEVYLEFECEGAPVVVGS